MNVVIEFNACDKAYDFKVKKRKEDLVDYVHQGSGGTVHTANGSIRNRG
jgi:hypothetical protein